MSSLYFSIGLGLLGASIAAYIILRLNSGLNPVDSGRGYISYIRNRATALMYSVDINKLTIVLGVLFLAIVLYRFKNIVPALLALVIVLIIPSQIAYVLQKKARRDVLDQLVNAVRAFTSEYAISLNIKNAIYIVSTSTKGRVSDIFRDAYIRLSYGENLEGVMGIAAKNMGISYGYVFANLIVLAHQRGTDVIQLLYDLSSEIRIEQEKENLRYSETTIDNRFNLVLILGAVAEYLFLSARLGDKLQEFMLNTQAGTFIFTLWLLSIVVWIAVDRVVNDY